jgi:hypothetical protein
MRVFLANVGANTSTEKKYRLRSPCFDDGTFEFVPIKESNEWRAAPGARRYRDLPSWTGRMPALSDFLPARVRTYTAHDDPDFVALTYGDIKGRGSNLEGAAPGDQLWFLARLWSFGASGFAGGADFYLVGYLTVAHNVQLVPGVVEALPERIRSRATRNAHWLRLQAGASEDARLLVGDIERSARFERAVRCTPEVAGIFFGGVHRAADDTYWRDGTQLQNLCGTHRSFRLFGSITRTVQSFLDDSRDEHRVFIRRLTELAREGGAARPRSS